MIHKQESQQMLLNKLNHGKQKTKRKEQSRNKVLKGKTTVWAHIQKKNKKCLLSTQSE